MMPASLKSQPALAVTTDTTAGPDSVIRTRGLTKRYGDHTAVDALDLDIRPAEVFGLLGPNGAGKTTTILMLLGLTEPTAGTARVLGMNPSRNPLEIKARVGYLPDDVGFYDDLTGVENLRYTAALNRLPKQIAGERIERLLDEVGLAGAGRDLVGSYSRGMRQRLGVADALVKQPSLLILDEPTVNIDPEGVRELLLLVERLRTDQGVTVVLSSHLLHQVQQVCDRIGIFVDGRLRACGTVDELASGLEHRWEFQVGLADVSDPVAVLRSIGPVASVARSEGDWLVSAQADIRPVLHQVVTDAGGRLTRLNRRTADLDVIYHRYFGHDDEHDH
jgi:ABC-2 type transport system ATP-binding protein